MSEVVIEDVGADAMQIFLEFVYGRDTSVSDFDTACSVLAVADKYDVPGLLRFVRSIVIFCSIGIRRTTIIMCNNLGDNL